jgi:hypothetical protein
MNVATNEVAGFPADAKRTAPIDDDILGNIKK